MAPVCSSAFQLALELAKPLQGSITGLRVLPWRRLVLDVLGVFVSLCPFVFQACWMHSARSCGLFLGCKVMVGRVGRVALICWASWNTSDGRAAGCPLRTWVVAKRDLACRGHTFPWKLKPGFINRVLVAVVFEASKCL